MDNIVHFHHSVVLADGSTLKHLNLDQGDKFTYREVNLATDLSRIRLASKDEAKVIFIAIGTKDAQALTPIDTYAHNLDNFLNTNEGIINNSHLVFIKPRTRADEPLKNKNKARYISSAYDCLIQAQPTLTLLSMDRKPRLVSIEYKKLFANIIEDYSKTSVVIKKDTTVVVVPERKVKSDTSSDDSSSGRSTPAPSPAKPINVFDGPGGNTVVVVKKNSVNVDDSGSEHGSHYTSSTYSSNGSEADSDVSRNIYDRLPAGNIKPITPSRGVLPEGRFEMYFRGYDFVKECDVTVQQNGAKIGSTEKFSSKVYKDYSPYFSDCIIADFSNETPQNQNLEIVFGDWGHVNTTMFEITQNQLFKINSIGNKNSKTARIQIIALKPNSPKTQIQFTGRNFKNADLIGKTDPFFKVFIDSPREEQPFMVYKSEVVENDITPMFNKFELVDKRFDTDHDSVIVKFFDKDMMGEDYIGEMEVTYKDLQSMSNYQTPKHILGKKKEYVGEVLGNVTTSGISLLPSNVHATATSGTVHVAAAPVDYRIYLSCSNLQKEKNQISYTVNGNKGKTEVVSGSKSPIFREYINVNKIRKDADFIIELKGSGSKKETQNVRFQDLISANFNDGLSDVVDKEFGDGMVHIIVVDATCDQEHQFEISVSDLPKMDSGLAGKACDPYYKLYFDERLYEVSKWQKQVLNAKYVFDVTDARWSFTQQIRIEFFDYDKIGKHGPIGYCVVGAADVDERNAQGLTLNAIDAKKEPKGLGNTRVSVFPMENY